MSENKQVEPPLGFYAKHILPIVRVIGTMMGKKNPDADPLKFFRPPETPFVMTNVDERRKRESNPAIPISSAEAQKNAAAYTEKKNTVK